MSSTTPRCGWWMAAPKLPAAAHSIVSFEPVKGIHTGGCGAWKGRGQIEISRYFQNLPSCVNVFSVQDGKVLLVGARRDLRLETITRQRKRHVPRRLELVEMAVVGEQVEQEDLHGILVLRRARDAVLSHAGPIRRQLAVIAMHLPDKF